MNHSIWTDFLLYITASEKSVETYIAVVGKPDAPTTSKENKQPGLSWLNLIGDLDSALNPDPNNEAVDFDRWDCNEYA